MLQSSRYSINAQNLARLLHSKPDQPGQYLAQLVEYSAQHPQLGQMMNLKGKDQGFLEYYDIDMILVLLMGIIIIIYILIIMIKMMLSRKNKEKQS